MKEFLFNRTEDPEDGMNGEMNEAPNRRRQTDRRLIDRAGKYERRRNRCGHCRFWTEGFCEQHACPMKADAFACPLFSSFD